MSYIEQAKKNKQNAEKADQLDQLLRDKQRHEEQQQVYHLGKEDGANTIIQDIHNKLAQAAERRRQEELSSFTSNRQSEWADVPYDERFNNSKEELLWLNKYREGIKKYSNHLHSDKLTRQYADEALHNFRNNKVD